MPTHEGEQYLTEWRIVFGDGTSAQVKDAIVEIGDLGPADDGTEDDGIYGRLGESMEFSASGVCVWHTHGKFEKLMHRTRNRMVRSVRYAKRFKERCFFGHGPVRCEDYMTPDGPDCARCIEENVEWTGELDE